MGARTYTPSIVGDPNRPHHQAKRPALYRLCCPSASCSSALASGAAEAARLVRDHPVVCPDPGRRWPETDIYPLVYTELVAR